MEKQLKGYLYRKFLEKETKKKEVTEDRVTSLLKILRKREPEIFICGEEGEYPGFETFPRKITPALPFASKIRSVMYPLIDPYAYADIRWDSKDGSLVYYVIEPALTNREEKVLDKLKEGLIQTINISLKNIKQQGKTIDFLENKIINLLDEYGVEVDNKSYLKIMYYIYRDFIGLGRIEPLMRDPYIEDISCDGVGIELYVVHQKFGSIKTKIVFENDDVLRDFVIKVAQRTNRYISYSEPLLDGTLPDGSRVQASLAGDVTTKGPTLSIRKFKETPFTPVDITDLRTASVDMLAYLWFLVESGCNILICGGVASGKTTLLNTISLFIRPDMKVVSIEDTRELNLPHENWIPGVSRLGFSSTKTGEVSMFDLLKESFRQNPDYLVVGEIRGKEASIMFQAMASGHSCISTMHAGSVDDILTRLKTKPINLSPGLLETLDSIILMLKTEKAGAQVRRVREIDEIEEISSDTKKAKYVKYFQWEPKTDSFSKSKRSVLLKKISEQKGIGMEKVKKNIEEKKQILKWLCKVHPENWKDVAKYISLYYKDKEKILDRIGKEPSKPDEEGFKCGKCGRKFDTKKGLHIHQSLKHDG